jgi:predicted metal-dependent phosphotriesterase family hydrolase
VSIITFINGFEFSEAQQPGENFGVSIAGSRAMEALEKMNPDGMLFCTCKTIPYLKQLGVTDQAIRTITVENPRRFFGGF